NYSFFFVGYDVGFFFFDFTRYWVRSMMGFIPKDTKRSKSVRSRLVCGFLAGAAIVGGSCGGSPTTTRSWHLDRTSGINPSGSCSWLASSKITIGNCFNSNTGKVDEMHITPFILHTFPPIHVHSSPPH